MSRGQTPRNSLLASLTGQDYPELDRFSHERLAVRPTQLPAHPRTGRGKVRKTNGKMSAQPSPKRSV